MNGSTLDLNQLIGTLLVPKAKETNQEYIHLLHEPDGLLFTFLIDNLKHAIILHRSRTKGTYLDEQ